MGDFGDQLRTIRQIDTELGLINESLHSQLVLHQAIRQGLAGNEADVQNLSDNLRQAYADAELRMNEFSRNTAAGQRQLAADADRNRADLTPSVDVQGTESSLSRIESGADNLIEKVEAWSGRYVDMYKNIQRFFGGGMVLSEQTNEQSRRLVEVTTQTIQDFAGARRDLDLGGVGLQGIFEDEAEALEHFENVVGQSINTFAVLRDMRARDAQDIALLGRGLGYTTDQTSTFIQRQISLTGEASTEMLEDVATFSKAIEAQTGLSSKQIARGIEDVVSATDNFGNVTVEEAAHISAALYQVGLDFSELDSMVSSFQGFESAARSVGDLTSVFGLNLDAMELMMAANENQGDMLMMVRRAFLDAGVSVGDLNQAQKRLIADQLNLSDTEAVERLLGPMGQAVEMMGELEAATEAPEAEGFDAVKNDILLLVDSSEASSDRIRASLRRAMGAAMVEELVMFDRQIGTTGQVIRQELGAQTFEGLIAGGTAMEQLTGFGADDMAEATQGMTDMAQSLIQFVGGLAGEGFQTSVEAATRSLQGLFGVLRQAPDPLLNIGGSIRQVEILVAALEGVATADLVQTTSPETVVSKRLRIGLQTSIGQTIGSVVDLEEAFENASINMSDLTGQQMATLEAQTLTQVRYLEQMQRSGLGEVFAGDVPEGIDPAIVNELLAGGLTLAEASARIYTGQHAKMFAPPEGEEATETEGEGEATARGAGAAAGGPLTINLVVDSATLATQVFNDRNLPSIMNVILTPGAAPGSRTIATEGA